MKIYKVKVNGKIYEVELESVTEATTKIETPVVAQAPVAPATGTAILKAPMQGTILEVKTTVGATVKKGQSLFILEAMKLENEIVSPTNGVVKQINVTKGQTVANQEVLAVFE